MNVKHGNKVVLVGNGAVGSSYAFAMVVQGIADDLTIIDLDETKVTGDVADLNHAAPYSSTTVNIKKGDYKDCADADIIVITAGAAQKSGETRLDLVEKNAKIIKSIVSKIMKYQFNGIFLIASNPVDILSYVAYKTSGLPKNQVIGSGTVLDTARLKHQISKYVDVAPASIVANIIGEHGDSELAVWSQANIAGQPVLEILNNNSQHKQLIDTIFRNTRDAAYEIIQAKGATYYGIAQALVHITQAILKNQNIVLTTSSYLEGEYNQQDVYIGVPTLLNRNGAVNVIATPLNDEEKLLFNESTEILKEMQSKIKLT
ncbi:L-lactate dehydrogenase [Staphylococcus arlettae]|uniref:L-lactate dehydrogenase n=1 Tax=Staphylococcus arlettae TaxID=29378 RepID=UPI000DCC5B02|nr:L-lactate dehydrogenase [Staphylococcus arlettae]MBK3720388.1 L-lactate dehydrogenase 1 [Staphylococcus arlettae]RBA01371.1 L-lactate dehydrogenase 1 [Staphylococcus arlettae]RBA02997.1 L-lactate dehydrogenase 1 [Staphylococcus arlettae]RBA06421.1 L-lactate dehydrogenase 1 [Staphylococcus arlettae]